MVTTPQGNDGRGRLAEQLAGIRADVNNVVGRMDSMSDRLDHLTAANANLAVKCEGLTAETRALVSTAREDIRTLFALDTRKSERIGAIEKDYLPKNEFERHVKNSDAEHARHREAVNKLNVSVAKVVATTAIIVSLLQSFLQIVVPKGLELFK
jgi:hypothetical protein